MVQTQLDAFVRWTINVCTVWRTKNETEYVLVNGITVSKNEEWNVDTRLVDRKQYKKVFLAKRITNKYLSNYKTAYQRITESYYKNVIYTRVYRV